MSKVLVLGASPLPIENEIILSGPGIRTWQFVKPLLDDKHQICLVCLQTPGAYKQKKKELIEQKNDGNLIYYSLSQEKFEELSYIQKIYDNFQPDCIFSISSFLPSYSAVQLKTEKPMWFDRGDLMSEAQIKASVENNNDYIYYFWKLEELVLQRGDIFSSVSLPQRFALIGRLGGQGRLSKYTVGYEFVHVISCGIDKGNYTHTKNVIRGKYVDDDDFVVLWSGGYNTWTDIDTLFLALEQVMAENKKIKFVSTGGIIIGQDEVAYPRFLKLINASKYKDRYIMLGWVPTEDLSNIYLESNLGINIDKYCYEVVLGSRHRLLDWMKAGLPILTTKPSELTQILDKRKMIFIYPINDTGTLAEMILRLSSEKKILAEYAQRAKDFVQKEFTYELTTAPFREWVKNPKYAPDKVVKLKLKERKYLDGLDKKFLHSIETEYIESLRMHINNLINERENLKNHVVNLENERENLKSHISNLESERNALKEHLKNLEAQYSNLQRHNQDLEIELANLKNHVVNLENERENLKSHISNLESERNALKEHLKNLENERENLADHLDKIHNSKAYRLYKAFRKIICLKI